MIFAMRFRFLPALVLPLALISCAGLGEKKYHITFHAQADPASSMAKTASVETVAGRQVYFEKLPIFTQDDFQAFQPFPSQDGEGMGAVIKLKFRGANALSMLSDTREGALLRVAVNRTPVDYLLVDEGIEDGQVVIWQGLKPELIDLMDKDLPRIKPETTPKNKKKWKFWKKSTDEYEDYDRPGL